MRSRYLPLYLSADLYRRLEQVAREQERDPLQQARYLLRQAMDTERQPVVERTEKDANHAGK